ncbi:MAG: lysophospholipid acyltransferase family protein [Candidatus Magasanikbacteria bacterium]|nr:lysophospholipid acyltransferase family protein [Candidatus Magasanikbacteria bacterium]
MKRLISIALGLFAFLNFVLATACVFILLLFKKNDGKEYPLTGHLSLFWGKWIAWSFFLKIKIVGLEKFNPNARYIIVANHQSSLDPLVIMSIFPIGLVTIAQKKLLKVPILGPGLRASGVIFVDLKKRLQVVEKAVNCLVNSSLSMYAFPSGTRKSDIFKTGVFHIAIQAEQAGCKDLMLLPVTIEKTKKVWPSNTLVDLDRTVTIVMRVREPVAIGDFLKNCDYEARVDGLLRYARKQIYG